MDKPNTTPVWKLLGCEDELEWKGRQFMNRETTELDEQEMAIYENGGDELCLH